MNTSLSNLPAPQEVRATFAQLMQHDAEEAVTYLYELGTTSGYINQEAIAQNIRWSAASPYGQIECTINRAKPEKDPRAIAAAAQAGQGVLDMAASEPDADGARLNQLDEKRTSQTFSDAPHACVAQPQCDLCWQNEEFPGTPEHPAKPGLRIAAVTLGGECWGLQYSPYAYFNEHCIALSKEHRPMKIDEACLQRLLDFVDQFPFYFIGANADLPIVGGSILSHDHFQGGRFEFPLMKAPLMQKITLGNYPGVQCGIVDWPASVLRLSSENRKELLAAASDVLKVWRGFSYEPCSIVAASQEDESSEPTNSFEPAFRAHLGTHTKVVQHNTLNPIVRKQGPTYIMDMVLRNNRTDEQHPWGIFHAPEWTHYIKKENIGLIEIMGMAILPPRLLDELQPFNKQEVAEVFIAILEATGVFKHDAAGQAGWDALIKQLNVP